MTEIEVEEAPAHEATAAEIAEVTKLSAKLLRLQGEVSEIELTLKARKDELKDVEEGSLPEAMKAAGFEEYTLTGGTKVKLNAVIFAAIPEEHRPAAFTYLDDNGHGDLIKHVVIVALGREQHEYAEKIVAFVKSLPIGNSVKIDDKESVHTQTLWAWVREQTEAGSPPPVETFGIFTKRFVTVKPPKKRAKDAL